MSSPLKKELKFCFVLPKFAPENVSGAELQILYLCRELISRKYQVHYVRERSINILAADQFEGIYLHTVPASRHFFLQWTNLGVIWAVVGTKATVVYSRVSKSYLFLSYMATLLMGSKLVWACSHDRETEPFKHRAFGILKNLLERIEHKLFVHALKKAHLRLVQTPYQMEMLRRTYGLGSRLLENAHPVPIPCNEDRIKSLLWVANFREFKRPDKYVELATKLNGSDIELIMVGEIASPIERARFEAAISSLGNLKYLGPLSVTEVENLMCKCSFLVNTSDKEGFPNTFIQAILRGTPLASIKVDPQSIILSNGIGIVEADLGVMAEKIKEILNSKEAWSCMSLNCRSLANERFSMGRYTDSFLNSLKN